MLLDCHHIRHIVPLSYIRPRPISHHLHELDRHRRLSLSSKRRINSFGRFISVLQIRMFHCYQSDQLIVDTDYPGH